MNNKLASLLSYAFGIIGGAVFLNIEPYKHDQEVRFNAWQSILLWVVSFAAMIVVNVLGSFVPFMWILSMALSLGMLAMWVFLMVRSYQGNAYRIPMISEYADKFSNKH